MTKWYKKVTTQLSGRYLNQNGVRKVAGDRFELSVYGFMSPSGSPGYPTPASGIEV